METPASDLSTAFGAALSDVCNCNTTVFVLGSYQPSVLDIPIDFGAVDAGDEEYYEEAEAEDDEEYYEYPEEDPTPSPGAAPEEDCDTFQCADASCVPYAQVGFRFFLLAGLLAVA